MDKKLNVTSLEDLANYKEGVVVELPSFGPDQPFIARIRRPSMMGLAKSGKIPNQLLDAANRMFFGDKGRNVKYDQEALKQTFDVIDVLCDAAFVEPTYSELKSIGVELSDDQYMFIFNFIQQGVKALYSFRGEQRDIQNIEAVQQV